MCLTRLLSKEAFSPRTWRWVSGFSFWGNLYMAEKLGGAFTEADQEIAAVLAGCAATAIEAARSKQAGERHEAC